MTERRTQQREAIREAVEAADRPLSPRELRGLAERRVPRLGQATVYRAIRAGVEEGWLKPVELPGGPTRYESAGKHHHHHFECTACRRVFDIEGCPSHLEQMVPEGFTLEGHDVVLYGRCEACGG